MTGRMVRRMRFQSLLMEIGMTGWMLAVYFIALAGPMPKSQLFWMGTLMRGDGVLEFLGQLGLLLRLVVIPAPPPPEEVASADAGVSLPSKAESFWASAVVDADSAQTSAAASRFS
jgi:hypothetical protein